MAPTRMSTHTDPRVVVEDFRVEAKLQQGAERLRPGMEGVAKITAGNRKLIWIWTRYLVDWVRLELWTVLP